MERHSLIAQKAQSAIMKKNEKTPGIPRRFHAA